MTSYQIFAPETLKDVAAGDRLGDVLVDALERERLIPAEGDILVLAHKIVSKAEGRIYALDEVTPSARAKALAEKTGKDGALVELILGETEEILWAADGFLLCRHRLGMICANAAVDQSNAGDGKAILLPLEPDKSAREIREALEERFGCRLGVLICDTHGRPFREGASGIVVGASGVNLLKSYIGQKDRDGRVMRSSVEAAGDELAAAATLLMGQGSEGRPCVLIRGLDLPGDDTAADMIRETKRDVLLASLRACKKEGKI